MSQSESTQSQLTTSPQSSNAEELEAELALYPIKAPPVQSRLFTKHEVIVKADYLHTPTYLMIKEFGGEYEYLSIADLELTQAMLQSYGAYTLFESYQSQKAKMQRIFFDPRKLTNIGNLIRLPGQGDSSPDLYVIKEHINLFNIQTPNLFWRNEVYSTRSPNVGMDVTYIPSMSGWELLYADTVISFAPLNNFTALEKMIDQMADLKTLQAQLALLDPAKASAIASKAGEHA